MTPRLIEPPPPTESGLANLAAILRDLFAPPQSDDGDWILATRALAELPFIRGGLKALYRFAADNPSKLRIRPHPQHARRRQVSAADVLRLAAEYERQELESLDATPSDMPSVISEEGLRKLADRMARERTAKRK